MRAGKHMMPAHPRVAPLMVASCWIIRLLQPQAIHRLKFELCLLQLTWKVAGTPPSGSPNSAWYAAAACKRQMVFTESKGHRQGR